MVKQFLGQFVGISLLVVLVDQIIKQIVSSFNTNISFLFIHIHYLTNTGAGFGILRGKATLLGLVSLLVAIAVVWYYPKIEKEHIPQILFALLLGGTIGNGIDRLFRGYVIDFIDVGFWPAFNIADMAITIAAAGLVFYYWKR